MAIVEPKFEATTLEPFDRFSQTLKDSALPGTGDPSLQKKIYALACERIEKEKQIRQMAEHARLKLRPRIKAYRRALAALEHARAYVVSAQQACAAGAGIDPSQWNPTFHPAKKALDELGSKLREMEGFDSIAVHPGLRDHMLKKAVEDDLLVLYNPLLGYGYDLPRFGSRPTQTWFVVELNELLDRYFDKTNPSSNTQRARNEIINVAVKAAFNVHLNEDAIKVAMYRSRKSPRTPPAPSNRNP
jgi:hypothetical protein